MASILEKYVAKLEWDIDNSKLVDMSKKADKAAKTLAKDFKIAAGVVKSVTKALVAASAAFGGFLILANKHTTEEFLRAKAMGQSAAAMDALGYALEQMGLTEEHATDLVEKMNNSIGEFVHLGSKSVRMSQTFGKVSDALTILGMSFDDIKDKDPAGQFIDILDAASKPHIELQQAQSAVSILFGGEASKVIGLVRTYDGSVKDLVKRYERLSALTDQGREGALKFSRAFVELKAVVFTVGQQFAGIIGEAVEPLIAEFSEWVILNRELIQQKIAEWAARFTSAVKEALKFLKWFLPKISTMTNLFWHFRFIIYSVAGVMAMVFGAKVIADIAAFIKIIKAATAASWLFNLAIGIWPILIMLAILVIEDLYVALNGGESVFQKFTDWIMGADYTDAPILRFLKECVLQLETYIGWIDKTIGALGRFWDKVSGNVSAAFRGPDAAEGVIPASNPVHEARGDRYDAAGGPAGPKNYTDNSKTTTTMNLYMQKGESQEEFSRRVLRQLKDAKKGPQR